ncbi:MAG: serine hydrolase [Pararhodobacter sp.]
MVGAALFWAFLVFGLALAGRAQATPFAAVVMDARSGEILHATNHDTRLHPASLTKMMTLYVAFEAIQNGEISLDTRIRVSRRAATEVPSRLGLREGQQIALRHLIRAAALRSGNDAATAIAEGISGSVEAFAARMNRTAAAIGMTNTRFHNAHGLTQAGHLSTARDMTILGRQLYFDFPQYYNLFSRRTEDAGIAQVRNTNSRFLDGYRGADGIKTGFTNAAGYNLTAMAERNGVRVIVTVFGGRSVAHRHEQVVRLMDQGFRQAPARVALRRPPRPNYAAVPQVASAAGSATGSESRAAGRVIRLQTAPGRSPFPAPRPAPPGEMPSEALLAQLQDEISNVLAEVAVPEVRLDAPGNTPEAPAAPQALAEAAAPGRSPVPQPRPDGIEGEEALAVARAAGFSTIEAEAYHDLALGELGEIEGEDGVLLALLPATDLPERAEATPRMRPEELLASLQQEAGTPQRLAGGADAGVGDDIVEQALAELTPEVSVPEQGASASLVDPDTLLAEVIVEDGLVIIPGLPALAFDAASGDPVPQIAQGDNATLAPAGEDALDLAALDALLPPLSDAALPPPPVLDGRIVLTASDTEAELIVADLGSMTTPPPMPEIVTRVSTSGGRLWSVDLGLYPSRFDAERMLMRVALQESGTLGTGVRRVGQRSGRFVAGIHSLTQEQAELACLRLSARAQPCEIIQP